MNNPDNYKEDLLRKYLKPENIEKAPEGLTSKVMNAIQTELNIRKSRKKGIKWNPVPVIAVCIISLLILASISFYGNPWNMENISFLKDIGNIRINFPEIDLSAIFSFDISLYLIYIFIGMLFFVLFDRILNEAFNNHKQE